MREYRRLVDGARPGRLHDLLVRCADLLPRLYAAGLRLPDLGLDEQEFEAEVPSPMATLQGVTGRHDSYRLVFDPAEDASPVTGSLSDDLADIYLDLVAPLLAFDAGHARQAVWEWRFNMRGHCGQHIVDALRPIHCLVHGRVQLDRG